MRNPFLGIGAVIYKEVIHIRRDSTAIVFALMIPILQMTILGFGIDTNIRQIKTVVMDNDSKKLSRELVDRLRNTDTYNVVAYVYSDREMNEAIIGGKARAVEIRPKVLFNPDSRSPNFFLPGLTAVLLLSVTTFLTAFAIVKEKEQGTLEQLFVTPVQPMGLLLGKILPYFAIGFTELCIILLALVNIFRVPIHGSVFLLLLLSTPYLFVSLSFGTLISTRAKSQAEAMQMAFLTFLPSIFFSGYIFPRETMPLPFYIISMFVPATYFINITRGIILRGAGLRHLWFDGLMLTIMGALLFFAAARRFQKKVIAA